MSLPAAKDFDPRSKDLLKSEVFLKAAIFISLWVTFTYFGAIPSWNPNTRFNLVRAIVEQHTVAINAYQANTGDKACLDGKVYSDKAPGLSFLAVPIHFIRNAIGKLDPTSRPTPTYDLALSELYFSTIFTVALLSAWLGVLLFGAARKLGATPSWALFIALAFALGTPALAYSSQFFAHQAAAAFLFFAYTKIVAHKPDKENQAYLLSGAALGLAISCEYPTALGGVALLVFALKSAFNRRYGLLLALGALPPLILLGAYNTYVFGAPWRIGYQALVPSMFSEGMSQGFFGVGWPRLDSIWGITFGKLRGLFFVAPITMLALWGLIRAALNSNWRSQARLGLGIVGLFFLMNFGYVFWNGGASFGPRHVIPALPFLALGLIAVPRRPWLVAIAISLTGFSVFNALGASAVGADLPEYGNVLFDHIYPALFSGNFPTEPNAYNLGHVLGLSGKASLLPLGLFWLATFPVLIQLSRNSAQSERT